jgi:hypothetical protein
MRHLASDERRLRAASIRELPAHERCQQLRRFGFFLTQIFEKLDMLAQAKQFGIPSAEHLKADVVARRCHGLIFPLRHSRLGFANREKLTVGCDGVGSIGNNRETKFAKTPKFVHSKDGFGTTRRNTVAAAGRIAVVRLNG